MSYTIVADTKLRDIGKKIFFHCQCQLLEKRQSGRIQLTFHPGATISENWLQASFLLLIEPDSDDPRIFFAQIIAHNGGDDVEFQKSQPGLALTLSACVALDKLFDIYEGPM